MAFEEFIPTHAKTLMAFNVISLRKGGSFYIGKSTLNQFGGEANYGKIYIDKGKKLIGIKFYEKRPIKTNVTKICHEKMGAAINVKGPLKTLGIDKVMSVYTLNSYEHDGLLVIDLKEYFDRRNTLQQIGEL